MRHLLTRGRNIDRGVFLYCFYSSYVYPDAGCYRWYSTPLNECSRALIIMARAGAVAVETAMAESLDVLLSAWCTLIRSYK